MNPSRNIWLVLFGIGFLGVAGCAQRYESVKSPNELIRRLTEAVDSGNRDQIRQLFYQPETIEDLDDGMTFDQVANSLLDRTFPLADSQLLTLDDADFTKAEDLRLTPQPIGKIELRFDTSQNEHVWEHKVTVFYGEQDGGYYISTRQRTND